MIRLLTEAILAGLPQSSPKIADQALTSKCLQGKRVTHRAAVRGFASGLGSLQIDANSLAL